MLMKTRVRNEQKRCSVASVEGSFVLDFLFLEPVLSFCRRVSRKVRKKEFFNHLICGFIWKTSLLFYSLLVFNFKKTSSGFFKSLCYFTITRPKKAFSVFFVSNKPC